MASTSTDRMNHTDSFRGPLPEESKTSHRSKHSYKLPRMVEGFAKVLKYALFLANCIILICGIATFAVGVWTLVDKSFMEELLGSDLYMSSASILIATGVIVTLISFLGCFGAIKEIKCMLLTFFIILFMIFIIMLVGGILGYVFRNEVEKQMYKEMFASIQKYGHETETAVNEAWDNIQQYFECCGLAVGQEESYKVWSSKNDNLNGKKVPESCCKKEDKNKIENCQNYPENDAYKEDCYLKMKDFVKKHALVLGGVGVGISCVLIVGMMLSCALFLMIN